MVTASTIFIDEKVEVVDESTLLRREYNTEIEILQKQIEKYRGLINNLDAKQRYEKFSKHIGKCFRLDNGTLFRVIDYDVKNNKFNGLEIYYRDKKNFLICQNSTLWDSEIESGTTKKVSPSIFKKRFDLVFKLIGAQRKIK